MLIVNYNHAKSHPNHSKLRASTKTRMKQLQIIYDHSKCVGAGLCESIDPEHFVMNGSKAELIGGKSDKHDSFILNVEITDEKQKRNVIESAMACPVNAIAIRDMTTNEFLVTSEVHENINKDVLASYNESKEWKMDPKGYFLIRIDSKNGIIEAGHCMERNIVDTKITGKNAVELFNTIIREHLLGSLQHAAYLGKELYKAELALKHKSKYVQDEDIKL